MTAGKLRPDRTAHSTPIRSLDLRPGRLLLGRSSAPQPVPQGQSYLLNINKPLFFLGKVPHGGAGV